MPYYNYKCDHCDQMFEEYYLINDRFQPEKEECPECGELNGVHLSIESPMIVSGIGGNGSLIKKAGDGWKEVLNKIKRGATKDNTIRT